MIGLICGLFFSLLITSLLSLFMLAYTDYEQKQKCIIVCIIFVIAMIGGMYIGCLSERDNCQNFLVTYPTFKQTIEDCLSNNTYGLERLELVEQAIELNEQLASYQYDCQHWWGFNIDDDVLKLSAIDWGE